MEEQNCNSHFAIQFGLQNVHNVRQHWSKCVPDFGTWVESSLTNQKSDGSETYFPIVCVPLGPSDWLAWPLTNSCTDLFDHHSFPLTRCVDSKRCHSALKMVISVKKWTDHFIKILQWKERLYIISYTLSSAFFLLVLF